MDEPGDPVRIVLSALTSSKESALNAVEIFSRMMVGLAFEGLDVSLDVSVFDEVQYEEIEEIEGDTEI